jgi:hypothetical protein
MSSVPHPEHVRARIVRGSDEHRMKIASGAGAERPNRLPHGAAIDPSTAALISTP